MPCKKINGVNLYYEEYGSGDKILLSTQRFFFPECHMRLLANPPYNYHVYLITMRGGAKSDLVYGNHIRDWTSVWAQDVLSFADSINAQHFYYSGVSHGCWAGWYIAMHHPNRLLGFCATSGVAQFEENSSIKGLTVEQAGVICADKQQLAKMAWMCAQPTEDENRLAHRQKCIEYHREFMLRSTPDELMVRNTNTSACNAKTQQEFESYLKQITTPTLIINGAFDNLSTPQKAMQVAMIIRNCRFLLMQELDHGGPDECPELIARECAHFFDMYASNKG